MTDISKVELDMQEVHELSLDLLAYLEEEDCEIGLGVAVLSMAIGRLLSPTQLTAEEEIAFIQASVEFGAAYFTGGPLN